MKQPGFSEAQAPLYLGHRDRLRDRFKEAGAAALPDYELLELLLFRSIPRADTKPLAKALIARFGSFSEVIGAPLERLMEIKGVGASVAQDLKLVQAAAQRYARGEVADRPLLGKWKAIIDYCRSAMAFAEREQVRILFLDKKNQLIADEVQQEGTIDHTPVYPREVMKRALELGAAAIILVHNHPSGDPTPSMADVEMTKKVIQAGEKLGILVHDHIIIGKKGETSFRALQLL